MRTTYTRSHMAQQGHDGHLVDRQCPLSSLEWPSPTMAMHTLPSRGHRDVLSRYISGSLVGPMEETGNHHEGCQNFLPQQGWSSAMKTVHTVHGGQRVHIAPCASKGAPLLVAPTSRWAPPPRQPAISVTCGVPLDHNVRCPTTHGQHLYHSLTGILDVVPWIFFSATLPRPYSGGHPSSAIQ